MRFIYHKLDKTVATLQMAADEAAAHEGALLESATDKNLDRYWITAIGAEDDLVLGVGDHGSAALQADFEAHKL